MNGLGCMSCDAGLGSIDFSTFTLQDWFLVGAAGWVLLSLTPPSFGSKGGRKRSSSRRRKKGGGGLGITASGVITTALVLGGAYLGYQVWQAGQSLGESLAQTF